MTKMFNDQGGLQRMKDRVELARSRMPVDVSNAHDHCSRHREEILKSDICGCFYRGETFPPGDITDWTDEEQTAFCPKCGIDSVIGSASGFSIKKEFLEEMNRHWF